ncbi:MAG TPA: HlyD family secretion protein [Caulobacteraceae bacterium]|nr:HlyD family secretion protein [Caulobacteraceae bacterium]
MAGHGDSNSTGPAAKGGGRRGAGDGQDNPPARKKGLLQHPLLLTIGAVVLIVILLGALIWWLHARHFETTDDAYVDTHIVRLAPQVSGQVVNVLAVDNERVRSGDLLVLIDSSTFKAQVAQLEAQKAQAQAQLENAQVQIRTSQAAYRQAQSDVAAAQAPAHNAALDLARYNALLALNRLAIAQQQLDQARATAAQTAAQHESALRVALQRREQIAANRAQVRAGRQQVQATQAQLDTANINLGYTRIVAPVDGYITNKTVALGNYVQPGTQMMAVVPTRMWITANYKETQLAHMRVGQPVTIKIDACPGDRFRGHVNSFQRGAGQAFGVLPPENATGNFVKVVQRVPVKIVFDNTFADCPLGPGLSVEPSVRVR